MRRSSRDINTNKITPSEDALYQSYFDSVYQSAYAAVLSWKKEKKRAFSSTYGELLYPSVKKILNKVRICEEDVFLDLGSGLAKCALQLFMQSEVSEVSAIEQVSFLHEQATNVMKKVRQDCPFFWEQGRRFHLSCGNFLSLPWGRATIVYSCSTYFSPALLIAMGNKINKHSSVRQVLSLRPLPTLTFKLNNVFMVECSWDSVLCFHYTR